MLLMVEKGIRGGICHVTHRYAKANKYMKNYDKDKEPSHLMQLQTNNLYGQEMSLKSYVTGFKWKKNLSKFNENFIKNSGECSDSDKGIYLKQILNLQRIYMICTMICKIYHKE